MVGVTFYPRGVTQDGHSHEYYCCNDVVRARRFADVALGRGRGFSSLLCNPLPRVNSYLPS